MVSHALCLSLSGPKVPLSIKVFDFDFSLSLSLLFPSLSLCLPRFGSLLFRYLFVVGFALTRKL